MNNYLSVAEFSKVAGVSRQNIYKLSKREEYHKYFIVAEGIKKVDIKLLEKLKKSPVNSLQEVDNEVDKGLQEVDKEKPKNPVSPYEIHIDKGLQEVDNEVDKGLQGSLQDNQKEEIERLKKEVESLRVQLAEKNEKIVEFAEKFAELAKNAQITTGIQTMQVKQIEEYHAEEKENGFFKRLFKRKK